MDIIYNMNNSVENSDINFTKWPKKKVKNKISALFMGMGGGSKWNAISFSRLMNNLEFNNNKNFKFISSIKLRQCFNLLTTC